MRNMKRIHVFGNDYLPSDNLAHKVASFLADIEVVACRSPEELLEESGDEMLILDVVKGIKKPMLIEDVSVLSSRKIISLHDFDLGFFLKLMKGLGIKKKIKIIGVPDKGDPQAIAKEVEGWT